MSELLITICDKCRPDAERRAVRKATFDVDGKSFVIDVCKEHDRELVTLTEALKTWTGIATPLSRRAQRSHREGSDEASRGAPATPSAAPAAASGSGEAHVNDIRTWARSKGLEVADRGRIADDVVAAYMADHSPDDRLSGVG